MSCASRPGGAARVGCGWWRKPSRPPLALIGLVILVAPLRSGAVERSGLPQVAIFLLLGALLVPAGLDLVDLPLESESLQVMATLALVLVLFIDAVAVGEAASSDHRGPARTMPKSATSVSPSVVSRRFSGFTSRWTKPSRWA